MRITTGWRAAPRNQPSRRRSGSRRRLGVAATAGLLGLPLITMASTPAHAADPPGYGFVFIDQASSQLNLLYTPNRSRQANSTGGVNQARRTGPGAYTLTLPGLNMGSGSGTTQISAHSAGGQRCIEAVTRPTGSNLEIRVQCYDLFGRFADAQFAVSYHYDKDRHVVQHGYVWANNPTASSYTPDLASQSNSTGGTNTISHGSTGLYSVRFPGFTEVGGNVQVTATVNGGALTANHCKVRTWQTTTSGTNVTVACYSAARTLIDSQFLVSYTKDSVPTRPNENHGAYALITQHGTTWTAPNDLLGWNSQLRSIQARKVSLGHYQVLFERQALSNTNVNVTAFGPGSTSCAPSNWSSTSSPASGVLVDVVCVDGLALTDSMFSVLLTSNNRI